MRGALVMSRSAPVGFRSMTCRVHLAVPEGTDPERVALLRREAERACVNLATLRAGVPVALDFTLDGDAPA